MKRKTVYMFVDELVPATRNAKLHAAPAIKASIVQFGFVDNIIHDGRTDRLIAGHGRLEALADLEAEGAVLPEGLELRAGRWRAPVTVGWSSHDDLEAEALGVALNRTPILGGFNNETLIAALDEIRARPDLFAATGFDDASFKLLSAQELATNPPEPRDTGDHLRPPERSKVVTKPGDVWLLGDHRIMCGDCRNPEHVATLLDGRTINIAVTSPPYAEQRDYDEDSGFVPIKPAEYVEWFAPVPANVLAHLADDGSWFVNIKPPAQGLDTDLYVFDLVCAHVREWGWHFATEFCWERNGVPKRAEQRFKNQFEPVYQFARGRWKMNPGNVAVYSENSITPMGPVHDTGWKDRQGDAGVIPQRGQGGAKIGKSTADQMRANQLGSLARAGDGRRPRGRPTTALISDVQGTSESGDVGEMIGPGLAYPGNRLPTFAGSHEAVGHAAAFPVGLPAWFIRAYTDPGDVVFDPFCGSGSTILAADQEGRVGLGMELSPAYVDLICARYQRTTGVVPVRLSTGRARTFWKSSK